MMTDPSEMTDTAAPEALPGGIAPSDSVPLKRFDELGLAEPLLRAIRKLGWEQPTKVQSELIPVALRGLDGSR
jgi:superfamily II DNA/RNA helicase